MLNPIVDYCGQYYLIINAALRVVRSMREAGFTFDVVIVAIAVKAHKIFTAANLWL